MTTRILHGDVRAALASLPADSIDCCVTSPPYWAQRDYGYTGQIGLEPTLAEHIAVLVDVFEQVRRVLKPAGSLWLNYGDCYASSPNGRSAAATKAAGVDDRTFRDKPMSTVTPGIKPKDLCLAPERLVLALQAAGWWVRSKPVWGKPNAMPDSAGRYRPSVAYEQLYLLTKSASAFYDAEAVRMPRTSNEDGATYSGSADGNGVRKRTVTGNRYVDDDSGRLLRNWEADLSPIVPAEVWEIPTAAFAGAHFATFPPALVAVCLKASCPPRGLLLDPFGGAGTTALVADRMGHDSILIEASDDYVDITTQRLRADQRLFAGVSVERVGMGAAA